MPNNKIIFDAIVTEKAIFLTRNFLKPKLLNFSEINVLIKKKIYIYIYTHPWHANKRCNRKYVKKFLTANFIPLYGNGTPLQYSCLENPMDGGA